tara:strand:+ start:16872 stop:17057 length:186 start_codon:yes stop_codon:yes gene_type:complete
VKKYAKVIFVDQKEMNTLSNELSQAIRNTVAANRGNIYPGHYDCCHRVILCPFLDRDCQYD